MRRFHSRFSGALSAGLLAILVLARVVASDDAPVVGTHSVTELRAKIDEHVSAPRFAGAVWSVKVASLESGRVLFEHHAERLMSPASNSKLYTAALALDQLGGEYQIRPPVLATATPNRDGRLAGDLSERTNAAHTIPRILVARPLSLAFVSLQKPRNECLAC